MTYTVMRTYLVRYRAEIGALSKLDAVEIHRDDFEARIGSEEGGTVEVLDGREERRGLGDLRTELIDLSVDHDG